MVYRTVRDDLYQLRAFTWTTVEPTNQSRNNDISAQLLNTGVLPLEEERQLTVPLMNMIGPQTPIPISPPVAPDEN